MSQIKEFNNKTIKEVLTKNFSNTSVSNKEIKNAKNIETITKNKAKITYSIAT